MKMMLVLVSGLFALNVHAQCKDGGITKWEHDHPGGSYSNLTLSVDGRIAIFSINTISIIKETEAPDTYKIVSHGKPLNGSDLIIDDNVKPIKFETIKPGIDGDGQYYYVYRVQLPKRAGKSANCERVEIKGATISKDPNYDASENQLKAGK